MPDQLKMKELPAPCDTGGEVARIWIDRENRFQSTIRPGAESPADIGIVAAEYIKAAVKAHAVRKDWDYSDALVEATGVAVHLIESAVTQPTVVEPS